MNSSIVLSCLPAPLRSRIATLAFGAGSGSFARNVGVMLVGTVAGQGASVLLAPALTRIYSPEEFGYFSVYTAVIAILGTIAALGLEIAIPIAETDAEMANLTGLSWLFLTVITSLVAIAAYLLPADFRGMHALGPLAGERWLLPFGVASAGAYFIMVAVATRLQEFRDIARTRVAQGLNGPVSQILLGLMGTGPLGLAVGFLIGQSSGIGLLVRRNLQLRANLIRTIGWRDMAAVARRYAAFPLLVSWARVLDTASGGWLLYMLASALFSPIIAGYIFLSDRVVGRPLLILSTSLLQVFTGEAGWAVKHNPAVLASRFRHVVSRQALVTIGWIVLANLAAAWVFPVLFGTEWGWAVPYLRALSLAYFALSVLHPVSTTLQMLERQVLAAAWQVGRFVALVAALVGCWKAGYSAVATLWIYSGVQLIAALVMVGLIAGCIHQLQVHHGAGPAPATG